MNARQEADNLRIEAKYILNGLFKIPEEYNSGAVDRFVDCIISIAILEVAITQRKAIDDIFHT